VYVSARRIPNERAPHAYDSRNFGRITAISGDMRIMQFEVKYGF
jgi:hypothetical protein